MTGAAARPVAGGPVAILSAVAEERELLATLVAGALDDTILGVPLRTGTIDGIPVALVASGIGKSLAGAVAAALYERLAPRALLFSGVAGGIAADLHVGDVVIADRIVDLDYGRREDAGLIRYRPGDLPLPGIEPPADPAVAADAALLARVRDAVAVVSLPARAIEPGVAPRVPRVVVGPIATGDAFLSSERVRDAIGAETGALAIEMEGSSIAAVARRTGIPWLVIRALSDRAGTTSGADFTTFVRTSSTNAAALVRAILPVV